jgi:hypothetical protein
MPKSRKLLTCERFTTGPPTYQNILDGSGRVDPGGHLRQLLLERGYEPGGVGGQLRLGAVAGHHGLARFPAEQLVVHVGVRLRPGHRDVAAAELGGEVGEDADSR